MVGLNGAVGSGWPYEIRLYWLGPVADVLVFAIGIRAYRGRNFIPAKAKL